MKSTFLSLVAMGLGLMVLLISLWKHADDRAYAEVVPEELQVIMRQEEIGNRDENEVLREEILPVDLAYLPKVLSERFKWWFTFDKVKKIELALELSEDRFDMSRSLMELNNSLVAVKTANKGVNYLYEAARMLKDMEMSDEDKVEYWAMVLEESIASEETLIFVKGKVPDPVEPAIEAMCERVAEVTLEAEGFLL